MLIKVIDTWCDLISIPKSSFHVRAKLGDSIIGPDDTAETKGLEDGDTIFVSQLPRPYEIHSESRFVNDVPHC